MLFQRERNKMRCEELRAGQLIKLNLLTGSKSFFGIALYLGSTPKKGQPGKWYKFAVSRTSSTGVFDFGSSTVNNYMEPLEG